MTAAPTSRRDRGATIPLVALLLPVLVLMTSFAVDLGRQRADRRTAQARADVIALDLVRLTLDGRTEDEILGDPGYDDYWQASAMRNGFTVDTLDQVEIEFGRWDEVQKFYGVIGTDVPNAVRVVARGTTDYFFQPGSGDVVREAVAMQDDIAIGSFSIGSSLARLSLGDSGLLNPLLGGLLGSGVNLGALDYQGLVDAEVSLLDLLDAQAGAGTVDELLETEMSLLELRDLTAQALTNRGQLVEADIIRGLPVNVPSPEPVTLGDLLNVASREGSALDAGINALDLLIGGAQVANGDNFIDLDLGIPGVTSLRMQVTEPPKIAIGPARRDSNGTWVTRATSANLRLELVVTLTNGALGLPLLDPRANIQVPIVVTGGGASGFLTAVDCDSDPDVLDVLTVPRPLAVGIRAVAPTPLARVSAVIGALPPLISGVRLDIAEVTTDINTPLEDPEALGSTTLQVPVGEMRSANTRGLTLGTVLQVNDLTVTTLGIIPLPLGIAGAVLGVLNPVLVTVDNALDPVLQTLGVRIGETDVRAISAQCERTGVKLAG